MPAADPFRGPRAWPPCDAPPDPPRGACRPGRPGKGHPDRSSPAAGARLTPAPLRLHDQARVAPGRRGWLTALRRATAQVGPHATGPLRYDLVAMIEALRSTGRSPFRFNPEDCPRFRVGPIPGERQAMEFLGAVRGTQTGRTRAQAEMPCDGNPAEDPIALARAYPRWPCAVTRRPPVRRPARPLARHRPPLRVQGR